MRGRQGLYSENASFQYWCDVVVVLFQVILVSCLMGASLGCHNIAAKESIANCPPTTVMTSTLVNFASTLTHCAEGRVSLCCHYFSRDHSARAEAEFVHERRQLKLKFADLKGKFITTSTPLVMFLVGAIVGAVVTNAAGFWSILVPIGLIMLLQVHLWMSLPAIDGAGAQPTAVVAHIEDAPDQPTAELELMVTDDVPDCEAPTESAIDR